MRNLIISLPPGVITVVLFAFFCAVCFAVRAIVLKRCSDHVREELADQAKSLATGVAATFAFFVGFAISIGWGAVTAAQSAVEQQAVAIQKMSWQLRNIPDKATATDLTNRLKTYAMAAAYNDDDLLARGITVGLPSAVPLEELETAVQAYADRQPQPRGATNVVNVTSEVVSASASVSAVANRGIPRPLATLLFAVAVLVTLVMGVSTVTAGRASMVFIYAWCVIPALSLTVVLALAFPFALRTGLTLAPVRAIADSLTP